MQDMTGRAFGRLTVLEIAAHRGAGHALDWLCICSCGNKAVVNGTSLRNGNTKSCGCFQREIRGAKARTHGLSRTKEHRAWAAIIQRCYNTTLSFYRNYGGRGITVSDEWRHSFEAFLRDMGSAPSPEHSVERVDNNQGYTAANCRWVTRTEQMRNKRSNRLLTHDGRTMTVAEWAAEIGIHSRTIRRRVDVLGWSVPKALSTPLM